MPDLSFLHASPFYELTALLTLAAIVGFIGYCQVNCFGYLEVEISYTFFSKNTITVDV